MNKNLVATTFYIPHIEQTVRGLKENKVKKEIYAIKLAPQERYLAHGGFEPGWENRIRFQVQRLNHSATPSCLIVEFVSLY